MDVNICITFKKNQSILLYRIQSFATLLAKAAMHIGLGRNDSCL